MREKMAIVLTGGMACPNRRFQNSTNLKCKRYVNYKACFNSTIKHIVSNNKNIEFHFYIHSWNKDLMIDLDDAYKPIASMYEDNNEYSDEFSKVRIDGPNLSQLSKALSQKKGVCMVENSNVSYDRIMIYRPDVLLWKDMDMSQYDHEKIYFNGQIGGDFHFIMNMENASKFKQLYDSAFDGNQPVMHSWVYLYVVNYMKKEVHADQIIPRFNQDCVRRIYHIYNEGKISKEALDDFGLDMEEIKHWIEEPVG
jgi:hypothetical protein